MLLFSRLVLISIATSKFLVTSSFVEASPYQTECAILRNYYNSRLHVVLPLVKSVDCIFCKASQNARRTDCSRPSARPSKLLVELIVYALLQGLPQTSGRNDCRRPSVRPSKLLVELIVVALSARPSRLLVELIVVALLQGLPNCP